MSTLPSLGTFTRPDRAWRWFWLFLATFVASWATLVVIVWQTSAWLAAAVGGVGLVGLLGVAYFVSEYSEAMIEEAGG